jgi:antitoxin (DNA-binding transcriptional repressor) of toxin-antitoxin stability system
MGVIVTANEAALHFTDLLDQIQDRGESFVITRNGEEVAQLTAPPARRPASLRTLVERLLAVRTGDPTFADDLERIQAEQPPPGKDPWDS